MAGNHTPRTPVERQIAGALSAANTCLAFLNLLDHATAHAHPESETRQAISHARAALLDLRTALGTIRRDLDRRYPSA